MDEQDSEWKLSTGKRPLLSSTQLDHLAEKCMNQSSWIASLSLSQQTDFDILSELFRLVQEIDHVQCEREKAVLAELQRVMEEQRGLLSKMSIEPICMEENDLSNRKIERTIHVISEQNRKLAEFLQNTHHELRTTDTLDNQVGQSNPEEVESRDSLKQDVALDQVSESESESELELNPESKSDSKSDSKSTSTPTSIISSPQNTSSVQTMPPKVSLLQIWETVCSIMRLLYAVLALVLFIFLFYLPNTASEEDVLYYY